MLSQKILKSGGSEMPFPAFWTPNCRARTSGNYSVCTRENQGLLVCMVILCEINVKKIIQFAILGTGQTTLLTKHEGCICTRKRPVVFLIFHPFVSILLLRTHSSRGKNTRIVCQPARQAAETMIRSISCSLQHRL